MYAKVIWLEGLSGAGKSTVGDALAEQLAALGLPVKRLDGDVLRKTLCADLGFSEQDRQESLLRAGYLAKQYCQQGSTVVASFITPSEISRNKLRELLGPCFVEVYVATPLAICAKRDPKGLYQKAFCGEIDQFTGVSAPFDPPLNADISINTDQETLCECVTAIREYCFCFQDCTS